MGRQVFAGLDAARIKKELLPIHEDRCVVSLKPARPPQYLFARRPVLVLIWRVTVCNACDEWAKLSTELASSTTFSPS